MLKKILLVLVFVSMIAVMGCKKEEPVAPPTETSITDQAGKMADQAAKDADAAKEEAGKQLENAGKELQK